MSIPIGPALFAMETKSSLLHEGATRRSLHVLDLHDFTMNFSLISAYLRSVSATVPFHSSKCEHHVLLCFLLQAATSRVNSRMGWDVLDNEGLDCWASLTHLTTEALLTPYRLATSVRLIPAKRSRTRDSWSMSSG